MKTRTTPRVLIIVLCYNGIALTLDCLKSLERMKYEFADVLVVDNASSDDTPAAVRARFPEAVVIETGNGGLRSEGIVQQFGRVGNNSR